MATAKIKVNIADLPLVIAQIKELTDQRDQARRIAVALEQEHAHLAELAEELVGDLLQMVDEGAIELGDKWPAAQALVDEISSTPAAEVAAC